MKSVLDLLTKEGTFKVDRQLSQVRISDLFDTFDHRVNSRRLYFALFRSLPNCKAINGIDCERLSKWIESSKDYPILLKIADEEYSKAKKRLMDDYIIYIVSKGLMISLKFNTESAELYFSTEKEEAQKFFATIRNFMRRSTGLHINLLVNDREGLSLKNLKSKKLILKLNENYNDDLLTLHPFLVKSLRKAGANGLILFHGEPGTGKSTYIRYLTGLLKKKIIFLSPRLAGNLDDPGFAKLLTENPNSVIIIEDAEDLLASRNSGSNSGISTLLNLTDGLLGTSLGIQFICTFNTPVANIDKALLRKGRLLALYEFGPLSLDKTRRLAEKLGLGNSVASKPTTLADIYNAKEPAFRIDPGRKAIGFTANVA